MSGQIQEMTRTAGVSSMDAAVLAAANIADSYFKEMEASERLRRQLKEALDESAQMKGRPERGQAGDLPPEQRQG